jgi:hypothetical protein
LPAGGAETPAIARFEARKLKRGHWRRQIVALGFGKGQKLGGHLGADNMNPHVASPRVAAAISVKAGHGRRTAGGEGSAQYVGGIGHGEVLNKRVDGRQVLLIYRKALPPPLID